MKSNIEINLNEYEDGEVLLDSDDIENPREIDYSNIVKRRSFIDEEPESEDGKDDIKKEDDEEKDLAVDTDYLDDVLDEDLIDTGSSDLYKKERISELTGKTVVNYVDNDLFCNAVIKWNKLRLDALEAGTKIPQMPDIIGIQIKNIAEGLGRRYNFRNYTYIDEMKADSIVTAIRAVKNFDPNISSNAFGYFNWIMWRSMTSRIAKEKAEHEAKIELLKDPMYMGYTADTDDSHNQVDKSRIISIYENGM